MAEKNRDNQPVRPDMTVLDCVSAFRPTEKVFKAWDERAGTCICCGFLFEKIEDVAERFELDLDDMLKDLNAVAAGG